MWWMIRIEECFIELKSWEAPVLQERTVPWIQKGRTFYMSTLSYSLCICFIPSRKSTFSAPQDHWWYVTINLHLIKHCGLALVAPISNSWEEKKVLLAHLSLWFQVWAKELWPRGMPCSGNVDSKGSSLRRGKSLGTWQISEKYKL